MLFCEELDLKLLKLVRDNPVLYDFNNVKYMDFNAREVAWQRIGDELQRPAADCKVRWINIRDVYRRILRKSLNDPEPRTKMYKYETELAFMRPFYKDVILPNGGFESDSRSNDIDNEDSCNGLSSDVEDDKPIQNLISKKSGKSSSKKKKNKGSDEHKEAADTNKQFRAETLDFDFADPVDAFLLSIGATLKTFSPYHLNLAKSKIFAVVQDHELQQIVQNERSGGTHDAVAPQKYTGYSD